MPTTVVGWSETLDVSPAVICQVFYVLASAAVLAVAALPASVRHLLTQYGARSTTVNPSRRSETEVGAAAHTSDSDVFTNFVAWVTSVSNIPHSWFTHFYVLSVCCSVFWAVEYLGHGTLMEIIARQQDSAEGPRSSMSSNQVVLAWFLMALQGFKRVYECYAVMKPSSSRMLIFHWFLGIGFYLVTSIAIWVEGSRSIRYAGRTLLRPEVPSLGMILGTAGFLVAWSVQHRCHRYLAGLKKYTLPEDGLFQYLLCPHYTCECLLYLSLAVLAAPEGQWFNRTLICAVILIVVNLGVTANGTRTWYIEKFGRRKVQRRWRMIPFVF